ncbi:uncharacterized protein DFL_001250 [Arthrobotrys flagrans]|uniref:Subtelomeric hrmA-associated cluster protein AFUB-079030/YDR124W-like helical bundle domain-containing protein n=1 Tax=Arthrobotrys flagrans TaxID=97331 RepID=A0A437AGJ7_ARTFL|nr:hypothetical protein DFL_001250 [Arthrobotrys flagrans]
MVTRDNTSQVLSTLRNNFPAGTSFSILAVTPDGKISIHASDILKPYTDKWYDEDVHKDARAAVETLPARKRSHISISLPVSSKISAKKAAANAAATAAATNTASQIISPSAPSEEEEVPSIAIPAEEGESLSLSTIRPRKKRRASAHLQESSIDTATFTPRKPRQRKNSTTGVKSVPNSTRIKKEADTPEGAQIESDWTTIDMMQEGEGDLNENNEDEEESEEEELQLEPLRIGDEEAVNKYIYNKFLQIQQLDCKTIAKCWIKVIEPKKQAHSPYNGGDSTKPWWWPEGAPHKEPDHLLKEDRLDVLLNIVRNGIAPICQLRASTDDAPLRATKKEILAEMYDVVDLELRLKEGNLDRDHIRFVKPFIKGNKRRKKRVPKTIRPGTSLPPKDKHKQEPTTTEIVDPTFSSIMESESNLASFFKKEEDQETADGVLVQRPDLAPDNSVYPGHSVSQIHDPQESYPRRQSTGALGAANPSDAPIVGSQHRSNNVPYPQHTSGRFGRDRLGTVNSPGAQFINQTSVHSSPSMTDVATHVFEFTPSPTSLSPYGANQSPRHAVGLMATTHADPAPGLYQYNSVFNQITYQIPSPGDITMEELYPSPVVPTNIFQPTFSGDAYSGFALDDTQSIQSYPPAPPPQFYPDPGMRDIAMTDGTNAYSV